MAYAVQADLNLDSQRLIELTDNAGAPGVIDTALLAQLEAEAEAIVDGFLGRKYVVPLSGTIPKLITVITAAIWKHRVYRHRPEMDVPPTEQREYENAMQMLEDLRKGEMFLNAPTILGFESTELSRQRRGWDSSDTEQGEVLP